MESWIATANSTAYGSLAASPFELVTGKIEDIGSKFRFPFGCPVSIKKTEGRECHYATANNFGIASRRATAPLLCSSLDEERRPLNAFMSEN